MKPQCGSIYTACLLFVFCSFSALVGCYRGASQSDIVQIVDTQVSTSRHVAMLVERSDHAALSGPTFFVFVSDKVYSLPELRSRLYALDPVFMVGRNGMTLHWSGPDTLTIHCQGCDITKDIIEKQHVAKDGVTIQYTGFP